MYLLPFNHPDYPPDSDECWKFFITCDDPDGDVADFLDAMETVGGAFEEAWVYASKLALSGKAWKTLIPDAKRFHDVGEVKCKRGTGKHETHKVWMFKHGRVRILWCYAGPQRVMLFGQTLLKNQNKIDPADIDLVGKEMQRYFTALDTAKIDIAGGEDNEQTFGKLFEPKQEPAGALKKGSPSRGRG